MIGNTCPLARLEPVFSFYKWVTGKGSDEGMKTYLEQEEIEMMGKAATNFRDRLLIQMLFRLGCRVSEALGVTVEDIDLSKGTVTIQHLKTHLQLSCNECGQRLGRSHTFCPKCGGKAEKAQTAQQEHRRQRVLPVDNETLKTLKESIQREMFFSKLTVAAWYPTADARKRILSARQRAKVPAEIPRGGWMIKGKAQDGTWIAASENLDKQVTAFSSFMCRVVGDFTKAYLKEMPYRVEDRWLMSVFLHLILDSISVWQTEENEIREFPYI